MTAILLICNVCGEEFWSNGFDHICYECACKQPSKVYGVKEQHDQKELH